MSLHHDPDPSCVLTRDGRSVAANDVLAGLVGASVDELSGVALREFTHPDDAGSLDAVIATAVEDSTAGSAEVRLRTGSGGYRWLWWRFTTGDDSRHILGLARDVTERRAGEAAAAQHAAVVASSADAIVTKTLDGIVLSWNPGAERIYGYSAAEMIDRSIALLASPGRVDEIATLLGQVARGEAVSHRETVRIRKDGARIDVSQTVSPIHDSRGAVVGASVIARDVTRRHVDQEQIRQIIEAAGDPFVLVNEAGSIVEWNDAATRVFGWRRDEALGRHLSETIIGPRDREEHRRRLHVLLANAEDVVLGTTVERTFVTRDGSELLMESSAWRATTPDGIVIGGFLRDQTARHQVERDLAAARDHAIEAGRLKSQFLASMSHEIRTPMNAVIGLTGLLLRSTLTPVQQRHARGVQTAGEVLLSLINDILDYSKIDAGKLVLEHVDFSPAGIVEDVIELIADSARSKDLEIGKTSPGCSTPSRAYASSSSTTTPQTGWSSLNSFVPGVPNPPLPTARLLPCNTSTEGPSTAAPTNSPSPISACPEWTVCNSRNSSRSHLSFRSIPSCCCLPSPTSTSSKPPTPGSARSSSNPRTSPPSTRPSFKS